jgi:S1-C subfamily serine protease
MSTRVAAAVLLVVSALCPASFAAPPHCAGEIGRLGRDVRDVYDKVRPAVVAIDVEGNLPASGVLVTPEGHVLTSAGRNGYGGRPVTVRLSDGRRLEARPLGWSTEWNVQVLKVSGAGPFPYVGLLSSPLVPDPGDGCVAVGFTTAEDAARDEPDAHFGRVAEVFAPYWCSGACPLFLHYGTGLFDLQGRLLGVCTQVAMTRDPVFTMTGPIEACWEDLTSGETNVDEIRFFGREGREPAGRAAGDATEEGRARAGAATVRLVKDGRNRWSGVIVSEDGHIATCAHHGRLPRERVKVLLADGREAEAEILGVNRVTDVALFKLRGEGPWPHVELGRSAALGDGTSVTVIGFPNDYELRRPLVRGTRVVADPHQSPSRPGRSLWIYTEPELSKVRGGDSGGGLFDADGRLVGIFQGLTDTTHLRIEALKGQWGSLRTTAPFRKTDTPDRVGPEASFASSAESAVSTVVEVLCDGKRACLGFVADDGGHVVTKRSELKGRLVCRTADGVEHDVKVLRSSREHDLALLGLDLGEAAAPTWREGAPDRFEFVAAVLPKIPRPRGPFPSRASPLVGLVTRGSHRIPGEPGWLGALRDGDRGIEVVPGGRLAAGLLGNDVILSVAGRPTPDVASLDRAMRPKDASPFAYAGESILVGIRRGQEVSEVRCELLPPPYFLGNDRSARRSGFEGVVDADMSLSPTECGAPVLDACGAVCGIAIATSGRGETHVLTADAVRRFLEESSRGTD